MSETRDPKRWIDGGDDAPAGFADVVHGERDGADTAQLSRVLQGVARQVGQPELTAAFHSQLAQAEALHAAAAGMARRLLRIKLGAGLLCALGLGWLAFTLRTAPAAPTPAPDARAERPPQPAPAAPAAIAPTVPDAPANDPAAQAPAATPFEQRNGAADKPRTAAADPAAELPLLEAAQRALRADPRRALALTEQHRKRFAQPQFEQEREMLAIEALLRLDRAAAARARAHGFERRHAHSSHLPRLRALLDQVPSDP